MPRQFATADIGHLAEEFLLVDHVEQASLAGDFHLPFGKEEKTLAGLVLQNDGLLARNTGPASRRSQFPQLRIGQVGEHVHAFQRYVFLAVGDGVGWQHQFGHVRQLDRELTPGGVTRLGALGHGAQHHMVDILGQPGAQRTRGNRFLVEHLLHQIVQRVGIEWLVAREQFIQRHTETEHVAVVRERLATHLLRGHVVGRTDRCRLHRLRLAQQRRAKIGDLHVRAAGDHDVCRLDVAVDDTLAEGVLERSAALEDHLHDVGDRQQLVRCGKLRKVAAHHQFHGDMAGILLNHSIQDADDVRVLELSRQRSLIEELGTMHAAELGIAEHLGLDDLQRHFLPGKGIDSQIHGPRGALAEPLTDVVLADLQVEIEFEGGFSHALCEKSICEGNSEKPVNPQDSQEIVLCCGEFTGRLGPISARP